MNTKKCTKCKIEKPLTEFHKDKSRKDGLRYYCKACIAQYNAEKSAIPGNKEKIAKRAAKHYAENKEKIAKRHAKRYVENKAEQPNCVYQIKNLENNKVYIGETIRGEMRWKCHLNALIGNYHENNLLQEDFNKHGEKAFEWAILKEFESEDKDTLRLEEARAIQRYLEDGVELYNLVLAVEQLKMLEEDKKSQ